MGISAKGCSKGYFPHSWKWTSLSAHCGEGGSVAQQLLKSEAKEEESKKNSLYAFPVN